MPGLGASPGLGVPLRPRSTALPRVQPLTRSGGWRGGPGGAAAPGLGAVLRATIRRGSG